MRTRDRRRAPARLAEALLVERARDVEADVDADEVHQLERAHPEAAAEPADAVDLLERRDPLLQQPQRLEPERAVAAVDEEARAVGGVDHVLAHRLAGRRARPRAPPRRTARRRPPRAARISGAGLKKCMPTTRSGRWPPPAIAVTSSEEVFVASTQCSETIVLRQRGEQLALELERSGAASITSSQGPRSLERRAPAPSRCAAAVASSSLQRPRAAPRSSWRLICSTPALQRLGHRVVQQRPRARQAARAARSRRPSCRRRRRRSSAGSAPARHAGTSALIPVSARPMISFWICEVPSYRVVTRTSRK